MVHGVYSTGLQHLFFTCKQPVLMNNYELSCYVVCSKSKLMKPWYRANDTAKRNEMARKAFEAVLTVTLRKPDSPEYRKFSKDVKARAKREYNETISGDDEVVYVNQSINQSVNQSINIHSYSSFLARRGELDFPRVNLATYGGRAFAYAGPTSWNSLPDSLKNINLTLQTFKRHLNTFLFSTY